MTPRLDYVVGWVVLVCGFVAMLCVPMLLLCVLAPFAYADEPGPGPDFDLTFTLIVALVCSTGALIWREGERWLVKRELERRAAA